MIRVYAAAILLVALAIPPVRQALESVMFAHMLVQIPLLAVAGVLAASALPVSVKERASDWNKGGVSGTLLALVVSSWWMVPRALDWALASSVMEVAKFATLPFLVGAPIALSWSALGTIGRGFVVANVLPMWAVVGWLYIAAPVRVCNYYLVDQQVVAGAGLLTAAIAVGVAAAVVTFLPRARVAS